jgi:CrcB protein
MKILFVFLGGGLGSLVRYGLQYYLPNSHMISLPTLAANLISCFLLGYLAGIKMRASISDDTYLLLATGFCGGFSTFSTLMLENWQAVRMGKMGITLLYLLISLILGYCSLVLGYFLSLK